MRRYNSKDFPVYILLLACFFNLSVLFHMLRLHSFVSNIKVTYYFGIRFVSLRFGLFNDADSYTV
jgi:hypothetical protein